MRPVDALIGTALRGLRTRRGVSIKTLGVFIVIVGIIAAAKVFSDDAHGQDKVHVQHNADVQDAVKLDKDKRAPVDYGWGPGRGKGIVWPNYVLGKTPPMPKSTR
jgi:hypothetical protein